MSELENPVIVQFPLRGEWVAPTTPGKQIPSHGTDMLGQRYAYDFLRLDWEKTGNKYFNSSILKYYLMGIPLKDCLCRGEEIFAPADGTVIKTEDGYHERRRVNFFTDMFVILKNAFTFDLQKHDIKRVVGNYIIMELENGIYALFAHLQKNSIMIKEGQKIKKGQILGKVGHSGNSTAPHLHFQLMDNKDLSSSKGIPCAFDQYEKYCEEENVWKTVINGVPNYKDRIRVL